MSDLTRRQFLSTGLGALASAGCSDLSQVREEAARKRQNVLFIAIDDLNDWVGCLGGHPDTRTPNIDRLAARGRLFSRTYCSAPACNPSRASLLSGVLPSTSGVYKNNQPWRPKLPDTVTLPGHFKSQGYLVHGRGKILHGRHSQDEQSWHEYIRKGTDPVPPNRPVNGIPKTSHFDWGPVDVPDDEMDDSKVAKWGAEFLQKEHDRPFFLACGLFRPHLPWYAPRKYHEMFPPESVTLPEVNENDLDDVPKAGRQMARPEGDHRNVTSTDNWRSAVSGYLASVAFADKTAGMILDALERSVHADNTIIVLWADHGWHLGEKLHWRKFALWEEATRCPLIISTPEMRRNRARNRECERTVTLLDIYPTLCDLCDLPRPEQLQGNSLAPLLENPGRRWPHHALTTHRYRNHTIRSERYRYIQYANGSEELYDHETDELEWTNLAADPQYDAIKKRLRAALPSVNVPMT